MKIEIKNRFNRSIILCGEYESVKDCLKRNAGANLCGADLYGANLRGADLRGADLYGADLCGADLMNAKFYGRGGMKQLTKQQLPDFLRALGFVLEN